MKKGYSKAEQYYLGLKNYVWQTGVIKGLNDTRTAFYLQQSNIINHCFKIQLSENMFLPEHYVEGSSIKILGRAMPEDINGTKSIYVKALHVEIASASEINNTLSKSANDETLKELYSILGTSMPKGIVVNELVCCGILDGYSMARTPEGIVKDDCMLVNLRVGPDNLILPVRIYGKRAHIVYKTVKKNFVNKGINLPIFFNSELRSSLLKDNSLVTYIHADGIKLLTSDLFKIYMQNAQIPKWIGEMYSKNIATDVTTSSSESI